MWNGIGFLLGAYTLCGIFISATESEELPKFWDLPRSIRALVKILMFIGWPIFLLAKVLVWLFE